MNTNKMEEQVQMSDLLFLQIRKYLQKNNLTLNMFCKKNNLDFYMTYKIMDRKIKMASYLSYLDRLDMLTRK